jgi:hypothetical protein
LYILENLQIQVAQGATYKTCPSSTGPLSLDSVTTNLHFKKKKMEKGERKKRRILLNGGKERLRELFQK